MWANTSGRSQAWLQHMLCCMRRALPCRAPSCSCYCNCMACTLTTPAASPPAGGKCLANCLAGETEVDGATCKTKAGKSYKKAAKSTPKVLAALAKPLEQRPPTKGKPTGLCPKGMSHCGAGKCAVNMLDADGCLLFSSMTASVNC